MAVECVLRVPETLHKEYYFYLDGYPRDSFSWVASNFDDSFLCQLAGLCVREDIHHLLTTTVANDYKSLPPNRAEVFRTIVKKTQRKVIFGPVL